MAQKVGHGSNRNRKPQNRIVSWGKYAGYRMGDVPTPYLEWFATNAYPQMNARKAWAKQELERRRNKYKSDKEE